MGKSVYENLFIDVLLSTNIMYFTQKNNNKMRNSVEGMALHIKRFTAVGVYFYKTLIFNTIISVKWQKVWV